jgi:flavodoxin
MANQKKILVVFFSLRGGTAFIAKTIADTVGADLLELRLKKPLPNAMWLRFFIGGMQAVMKKMPELGPLEKNPADYDVIFLGTPIWAGNFTPALRTFLSTAKLTGKQIALFFCCGSSTGKGGTELQAAVTGNSVLGDIAFTEPIKGQAEKAARASEWAHAMVAKVS